ncbi:MAG: DUF3078 domain-containing protein [Gemmatimonadetes bacterium]|nr:DUF3078 domain-containing protein [Gemmatimonadota bacterium]MBT5143393.1 DUF3078 domain-containing protein [Gemmatimonadota bacterium]MBT5586673.1 DUF3078 domain-containing protein [Gemmatimonadota bacterium]MBT5963428.1 DUF3078 domain-containing protein [Gemmatimonadota bacterium]MBT6625917.1 DUF3078 domain-containing protein [Gemmatimonadota bacterium]
MNLIARYLLLLSLSLCATTLLAQEEEAQAAAEPASPWTHQLVADVTANQVALKDWAAGGDDAFAWGFSFNGTSQRDTEANVWATSYKFAFGQNKLGDQDIRKTVDRVEVESALTMKLDFVVDPYVKTTLKTQAFRGHIYDGETKTAVSGLFDPAYFTQSAGAAAKLSEQVSTRLGAALRQIMTRDFNGYSDDDATTKIEKLRWDGGLESVTDVNWPLADNILLTSKLEIFVPLNEVGDRSIGNDATLTVKLSDHINLNVNLQLLDDPTASDELQLKQTTAFGVSYNLF